MITRTTSLVLALGLGITALPALVPAGAATAAQLPCIPYDESFFTNPELAPGRTSRVSMSFPGPAVPSPPEQRIISRPDGSEAHEFTVTYADPHGVSTWVGTDTRAYTLPDLGTWILHDSAGQPWRRFTAKAASRFASFTGPGRIVTAGESFTVAARLEGWTATGTQGPVRGMPVSGGAVIPTGTTEWVKTGPTSAAGTISLPVRAVSNRKFQVVSAAFGCYSHGGTYAPDLTVQVRKRITATSGTTTPALGQYVQVSGTVYPARAKQPIYLQRWNGTSFETVTPGQTNGSYTFAYRPTTPGKHVLRVYTPYDSWHVSSASPNLQLDAR